MVYRRSIGVDRFVCAFHEYRTLINVCRGKVFLKGEVFLFVVMAENFLTDFYVCHEGNGNHFLDLMTTIVFMANLKIEATMIKPNRLHMGKLWLPVIKPSVPLIMNKMRMEEKIMIRSLRLLRYSLER